MASSNTSRLSAASLAAALPGRSRAARASPVASAKQNIGWNPNPPLKLGAVPSLFSEWNLHQRRVDIQNHRVVTTGHRRYAFPHFASDPAYCLAGPHQRVAVEACR